MLWIGWLLSKINYFYSLVEHENCDDMFDRVNNPPPKIKYLKKVFPLNLNEFTYFGITYLENVTKLKDWWSNLEKNITKDEKGEWVLMMTLNNPNKWISYCKAKLY